MVCGRVQFTRRQNDTIACETGLSLNWTKWIALQLYHSTLSAEMNDWGCSVYTVSVNSY